MNNNLEQFDTTKVKLTPLEQFIKREQSHMLKDLKCLIKHGKAQIRQNHSLYKENADSEPTIDVRLCVDKIHATPHLAAFPEDFEWLFRTGHADYDQRHSEHCRASCIGLESDAESLLTELVSQLLEGDF